MSTGFNVGILGATGMVGQEFIKVLVQRKFPMASLKLLASGRSEGRQMRVGNKEIKVEEATPDSFKGLDVLFASVSTEMSKHFSPMAAAAGAVVIDDSNAFRMEPTVPLVVPEINMEDARRHKGIIAGPNCVTIPLVLVLNPLHKVNPIKRITADTYQSVSGTGTAAVEELRSQTPQVLAGQVVKPTVYPHQIAFNVLPEIDVTLDSGYTKEEQKMVNETRKIMHAPEIIISCTCVRVPVFLGHSEAVHIDFTNPITPDEVRAILSQAPGVKVQDDMSVSLYPMPVAAAGTDEVFVGRIRQHTELKNNIALWLVTDNIRKGAALNAVQVAEEMVKRGWLHPGG